MRTLKNSLYYLLFLLIGYFIYRFQIEKSFNLLTIYTLSIGFSLFAFSFKIEVKKTLPLLFLVALFAMYGIDNADGSIQFRWSAVVILILNIILALGILLIPYNLRLKKILIILFGAALAIVYVYPGDMLIDYRYVPFVIGSFFMFRSISYLHEIRFMKKEIPLIDKINYFLLTPNFSMPLFPIVDYKTFTSSYQGINVNTLNRATLFICRGLLQLFLYRFIYHHIVIPIDEVKTALDVVIFLVANYMIVLRVVGAYHIAIGLIMLVGYNLPDIFNNFFFATGFSDLWRRINTYWLNFMLKVFYYPIYFKIKRIGVYKALFISTFLCFIITWLLHSYQWFWLKGFFPLDLKDAIFWLGFGLLVSLNTLWQQRKLEQGFVAKESPYAFIRKAFAGLLILLLMSGLWSIWTSGTLNNWWNLVSNIENFDLRQLILILMLFSFYIILSSAYHYYEKQEKFKTIYQTKYRSIISYAGLLGLLLILHFSVLFIHDNRNLFFWSRIQPLISEQLNKADLASLDNGYYSNLISTNDYCSQIWINDTDNDRNLTKYIKSKTTKPSYDLMLSVNIPNASAEYNNISYTLNSVGLRDKEYPKAKPDSCYRIIILGGSYECGNGISDGKDFISQVEEALNDQYVAIQEGNKKHIEIINFSSHGYYLLQRFYQYKDFAQFWEPDAILLFIHTNYNVRMATYVNRVVNLGYEVKDPYLKNIIITKQIQQTDNFAEVRKKLGSYADSLNFYALDQLCQLAAEQDSTLVVPVYLPAIKDKNTRTDSIFVQTIKSKYNLNTIYLTDVYHEEDISELSISDIDFHPNKKANQLISDELIEKIINNQDYFNLKFTKIK
ncbi:MAG TPA: hypothetical protein PKM97_10845 [Bacteroidia bacterium]|nr:hypothetical protein [Bacteroidia bacterium]